MSDLAFALALVFAAAFALNLLAIPLARAAAAAVGLVDRPDGRRKLHGREVPVAGGPAVLFAVAATIGAVALRPDLIPGLTLTPATGRMLLGLLGASALICALGVVDDARGLRGTHKLVGQLAAVLVVVATGVTVDRVALFGWEWALGPAAVPVTVFFLLGAINSLNLLDGMDGLLGSVGLIVCVAFGSMAVICGQPAAACVAFALAGALLGFLRYNFPPASIFMGDSGSMLVGLVVGVLAIHGSLKAPATVALIAPACVLVVPIFDTGAAIVRRKFAGRSVFSTDRGHLHHCLLRSGLTRRGALGVVAALSLLGMGGGLACVLYKSEALAAVAAAAVVALLLLTRLFGYSEVRLVCRRLEYMARFLFPGTTGAEMAVQIQGTINWNGLWRQLADRAARANLQRVRLDIEDPLIGESFHARSDRPTAGDGLKIVFPVRVDGRVVGRVEASGGPEAPVGSTVEALSELVRTIEAAAAALISSRPGAATPVRHALPALPAEPAVVG